MREIHASTNIQCRNGQDPSLKHSPLIIKNETNKQTKKHGTHQQF